MKVQAACKLESNTTPSKRVTYDTARYGDFCRLLQALPWPEVGGTWGIAQGLGVRCRGRGIYSKFHVILGTSSKYESSPSSVIANKTAPNMGLSRSCSSPWSQYSTELRCEETHADACHGSFHRPGNLWDGLPLATRMQGFLMGALLGEGPVKQAPVLNCGVPGSGHAALQSLKADIRSSLHFLVLVSLEGYGPCLTLREEAKACIKGSAAMRTGRVRQASVVAH